MRTHTTAERNRMAARGVIHHLRVEVENADRTYIRLYDLNGVDWVEYAQFGESADQSTGTATVRLRRTTTNPDNLSTAPLIGGSPLNRNNAGAYAPLLDTGRNLRITTAVTAPGVAPVDGDWKLMGYYRIDDVKWNADPVELSCRDWGGWLVDRQIEEARVYGGNGPEDIEAVMADILADWPPLFGTALYTPASPHFAINNNQDNGDGTFGKKLDRKSVLEALQQDYALLIGGEVRYRFDASDNYRLTFRVPDRTKTVSDDTFGPDEYQDITALELSDADVRNRIVGKYYDSDRKLRTRVQKNDASQAKYGIKWMEIQLALGDAIDTDEEMDALLAAAASDLGEPFATHEMRTLYYWPVQLGDLYTFQANGDHYDDDQHLGVSAYTHEFQNGEAWTTIQCRGNVVGSYHDWLRRSVVAPPVVEDLTIRRVTWNESEDGLSRQATVECGVSVDTLHVHHRLWPNTASSGDPFDFSETQDEAADETVLIIRPDVGDGLFRFSIPHPSRAFTVPGRLVPRSAPPSITEGESVPFQVMPAPPAIAVGIHPTRNGDTGALSISVTVGVSDAPIDLVVMQDTISGSTPILDVHLEGFAYVLDAGSYPALGGIALPAGKDYLTYRVLVTDVNGLVWPFGPAHLGRDPLADCTATLLNYRANPKALIVFGPDTDSVQVVDTDGKTKTWDAAALALAGSPLEYERGVTVMDDSSVEPALTVDETASGFTVRAQGGGTWTTILGPADLHGQPKNPPTALVETVPNSLGTAEDVFITPNTATTEKLHVYFRDGATDTALQWRACVGAADRTPLEVTAGTRLGPATYFARVDGLGSPSNKLAAIATTQDQLGRYGAMVEGVESGVQSWWESIVVTLQAKPWNQNVTAEYLPATGVIQVVVMPGARALFEVAQIADNISFTSPTTQTATATPGTQLVFNFPRSLGQRGKTYYVRVTPNNLSSGLGLDGDADPIVVQVGPVFDCQAAATEPSVTTGRVTLTLADNGSVLNTAFNDSGAVGAFSWHVTKNGVTTIETSTTVPSLGATTGTYTKDITLDPLHTVLVQGFAHLLDGSTVPIGSFAFDSNKIADLADSNSAVSGTSAANEDFTLQWDTDATIGANCARYSLDNGVTWTTVTVTSTYLSQFTVARTASIQTMLVQAKNAIDGNWGNQSTLKVSAYVTEGPSISAHFEQLTSTTGRVVWSCSAGTALLSIDGGTASTPSASPIAITLDGTTHSYLFTASQGGQTLSVPVAIPAQSSSGSLGGAFSGLTNAIHTYANPGIVDFGWAWSGGTVAFELWVRDPGRFGDNLYHNYTTTSSGATSYTYTAGESLSASLTPTVTIGFYLRAISGETYGPTSTALEVSYGSP